MSTSGKNGLLQIIALCKDVNEAMRKKSPPTDALDMLISCQEGAAALGNYLEALGKPGQAIAAELEDYCESLYQLSCVLEDVQLRRKSCKKIIRQLASIESQIQRTIPEDKKEIVFFPYKASMWDSMESIWRAAIQDDRCVVYVVPVPYYDRNMDGSLGKLHYEGGCFPQYVPVAAWETYDISLRRPDIIYIHNPYDETNYVTSVHPVFYASRLQKYTNMLVYIPYFVGVNDIVEAHFCTAPAVLYADKVVVQSEKVRQIYLEELRKLGPLSGSRSSGQCLEKKIIALGSPKCDKAISAAKEKDGYTIPAKWMPFIINSDGTRKKILLYNTSVSTLLKYSEILEKMERIFSFFAERQDIVLLWRPHPLYKTTLQSMRPALLMKYIALERHFQEAGQGIFDDSTDPYCAIALSDAYYGDGGSLVELYKQTGKQLLIQDPKTDCFFDAEIRFCFLLGPCFHNGTLYGMQIDRNAILALNIESGQMCYFGKIPNLPLMQEKMFHASKVVGSKLYWVPFYEDRLVAYDFEKHTYEIFQLELRNNLITEGLGNFLNICFYEEKLVLLPYGYRAIVSYDMQSGMTAHSVLPDEILQRNPRELFCRYEFLDDSHLLLPSLSTGMVVIYDLENSSYAVEYPDDSVTKWSAVIQYREAFWFMAKNRLRIVRWDGVCKNTQVLDTFPEECVSSEMTCFGAGAIFLHRNELFLFPARSNLAVKADLDTGKITVLESLRPYCEDMALRHEEPIFNCCTRDGPYAFLQYQLGLILKYDMETGEVTEYKREIRSTPEDRRSMENDFFESFFSGKPYFFRCKAEKPLCGPIIHQKIMEFTEEQ